MKYTVLDLTQAVLSSMDSDEVSSINDTVESQQVVEIIKTVIDDMTSRGDLQTNKTVFNLTASNDDTKPILMVKPDDIDRIEWIKYNVMTATDTYDVWDVLTYLPFEAFIERMHMLNTSDSNVASFQHVFDSNSIKFVYRNDTAPQYYTTFDDNTIFFDSYDSTVDTTLQSSKTLCYGNKATSWEASDTFVPNLQPQQFALLLSEAKSLAWAELKQTVHTKAESMARKNWMHLQHTRQEIPDQNNIKSGSHNFSKLPNFGRR